MVKILRVRQAGTGSGGSGNPKAVPGVNANKIAMDVNDPRWLAVIARARARAWSKVAGTSIGSKGRL
jgi:hypothetical protein